MDRAPVNRGLPLGSGPALPHPRSGSDLRQHRHTTNARHGHPGQAYRTGLTLAEWFCRTADRVDPARVPGPLRLVGRGASPPDPASIRSLLQCHYDAPVIGKRCAGLALRSADRNYQFTGDPWRPSSPLCAGLDFRYTQVDDGKMFGRDGMLAHTLSLI